LIKHYALTQAHRRLPIKVKINQHFNKI